MKRPARGLLVVIAVAAGALLFVLGGRDKPSGSREVSGVAPGDQKPPATKDEKRFEKTSGRIVWEEGATPRFLILRLAGGNFSEEMTLAAGKLDFSFTHEPVAAAVLWISDDQGMGAFEKISFANASDLAVSLSASRELRGTVVNGKAPVKGALVEVQLDDTVRKLTDSDEKGGFSLYLPSGTKGRVRAMAAGASSPPVDLETVPLVLDLQAVEQRHVMVQKDGAPFGGDILLMHYRTESVLSVEAGRLELTGISAGHYVLSTLDGEWEARLTLPEQSGETLVLTKRQ